MGTTYKYRPRLSLTIRKYDDDFPYRRIIEPYGMPYWYSDDKSADLAQSRRTGLWMIRWGHEGSIAATNSEPLPLRIALTRVKFGLFES